MNAPVADKEVKIIYSAYNTFSAASFVYTDLLGVVPCFVSETGDSLTCTEMQRLASSPALSSTRLWSSENVTPSTLMLDIGIRVPLDSLLNLETC
jgi:hypothetical protein